MALSVVLVELLWIGAVAQTTTQSPNGISEVPITFATPNHTAINGMLCIPKARAGRVPVVVLVTSAGFPGDNRSEPESVFYTELAHGLAAAGIASVRYGEPSALERAGLGVPPNVEIANGLAALQYAGTRPEVNPTAVFVLGYDAGARLLPWIAGQYSSTRGMILMGGNMLPAEQVAAMRTRRQLEQRGKSEQDIRQDLASQNQMLADIRDGKVPGTRMIYGAPASYWLESMNRNPLAELRNTRIPALVLQGARDRQIPEEAYEKLQAALGPLGPLAVFRWFDGLNHEFGQAQTTKQPAPLDEKVIEVLRNWMISRGSGETKR
jgi:dienelactone hydrolase